MVHHFHLRPHYGFFVGVLDDNVFHKHYALQLSVALNEPLELIVGGERLKTKAVFVNSNVEHQLRHAGCQLTLLINPLSGLGHLLRLKYGKQGVVELDDPIAECLIKGLEDFEAGRYSFQALAFEVDKVLSEFMCLCESVFHLDDRRVLKAIHFLDEQFDRIVPLKEVAELCCLSESRFLHLFKEKTELNFRRYQLWNKLVKSLSHLTDNPITETAHHFGFADSSHYARSLKETFGVTPKFFHQKG